MSRVIKTVLSFLAIVNLGACAQRPVFSVEVLKSATPSPIFDEPTQTYTPVANISIPGSTPAAPAMPADFSPVLYGRKYDANTFFVLLGGMQGGTWLAPDLAASQFTYIPAAEYDVYTFAKENFPVQGYAPQFSPASKSYTLQTEADLDRTGMVGVVKGWPVLQRDVQELSPDNELYRQAVLDWLRAAGLPAPELDALRIFRVDVEGDGTDEIFLSATRLDGSQHSVREGDYSVILMRRVTGNEAVTIPVVGEVYPAAGGETTFPRAYSPVNFIDLNRDGVLELVVDIQRWEADGAIVYQIDGQDVIESLRVE
ncbi:MAG TPA: hypothetical protein VFY25_13470 [Anaerolineales bacterium]|nr:hypothetical protein [Anaerolineales bacterium]